MQSGQSVLIVGGPDVDARLELMRHLKNTFHVSAFGSDVTLNQKFLSEGFSYTNYPLTRGVTPLLDLITFGKLFWHFRKLKPQIVHAFDTKPCVWARFAARLVGVPVVIGTLPGLGSLYVNDSFIRRTLRFFYQYLQALACHLSDLTIFQNHEDLHQFTNAKIVPINKATVIPGSGVNTTTFSSASVAESECITLRNELGISSKKVVVTMISRVIRSKGILEFMKAAESVLENDPNIHFLLVGPDDHKSMDRLNDVEIENLRKIVNWMGPRIDIPAILAISDVFVFPSYYREGVPRVLLEAASMGLAIVTTDLPGCKEVVENGVNGFLVPVNDEIELSRAIQTLVGQPDLRQQFGQNSRKKILEKFDQTMIFEQTRKIYQRLLVSRDE